MKTLIEDRNLDSHERELELSECGIVYVEWGRIGYNKGPLYSDGFTVCSAVGLSNGEEGFLAHAYPIGSIFSEVGSVDVVDKLVEAAEQRDIDPATCHAFVSAGDQEYFDRIVGDLRKRGIPIRSASINGHLRDVRFDPVQDVFEVVEVQAVIW